MTRMFAFSSILVLIAASLGVAACDDGLNRGESGQLQTFPRSQIAFSQVGLGDTSREPLNLTNVGTDNLRILDVRWDGSEDIVLEFPMGQPQDVVLTPDANDIFTLEVAYSPTVDIVDSGGDVVIESTDPDDPEIRIPVLTQELGARIQVTPDRNEGLNFGAVGVGASETRTVSVTNVGVLPLEITNVRAPANNEFELAFDDGISFPRDDANPFVINDTSQTLEFQVTYSPSSLGQDLGDIVIISNDPRDPEYRLPLIADSDAPCLRVSEETVEFTPPVAIGAAKTRNIVLESCGGVPVVVESLEKVAGGSAAIFKNEPNQPIEDLEIMPGESEFFEIIYAPIAEGTDTAEFIVRSNDPLRPSITIQVLGTSTSDQCPTAEAKARIEGSPVLEDQIFAAPLDEIVLDGTRSTDAESSVEEFRWELRSAPDDSTSTIIETGGGTANLFLDVVGDYEACLVVVDAQGTESCNEDCVQIRAAPTEKLRIQLVWSTPNDMVVGDDDGTDVDLHFTRIPQGSWGDTGDPELKNGWDIFFDNREATWLINDGAPENPNLDRDDTDGEGPEHIFLDDPNACSWYAVGIHYFDDKGLGESLATVRVFVDGKERFAKLNIPLETGHVSRGDFWQVALIHWDGSTGRVFDVPERFFDGDWIGVSPTVPDDVQMIIDDNVPACSGQ